MYLDNKYNEATLLCRVSAIFKMLLLCYTLVACKFFGVLSLAK